MDDLYDFRYLLLACIQDYETNLYSSFDHSPTTENLDKHMSNHESLMHLKGKDDYNFHCCFGKDWNLKYIYFFTSYYSLCKTNYLHSYVKVVVCPWRSHVSDMDHYQLKLKC